MDPELDDKGIDHGDSGSLSGAEESRVDATEDDDREHQRPKAFAKGLSEDLEIKRAPRDLVFDAHEYRITSEHETNQKPRPKARSEKLGDRSPAFSQVITERVSELCGVDNGVDDHRDTWGDKDPKRTCRGDEANREFFGVFLLEQRRIHDGADSDDGDGA